MNDRLRHSIVNNIAAGMEVGAAYEGAAFALHREISGRLAIGQSIEGAVDATGMDWSALNRPAIEDPRLMTIIVSTGGIANIPDAACVEARLRDIPHPSRDEIEKAFKACLKSKP